MIHKQVLPESFDFGVPSVELIGVGSKGLDKTAMQKRASAFDDILDKLEKKANRTYLHVITTGAFEKYGANNNCDAWNGASFELEIPYPEDGKTTVVTLDGGLSKYHDDTYMKDGAVYQEHQTKKAGVDPSGEIISARYNTDMQRGELLIAVDTEKWAPRLQKKASGQDIYLSIGASVSRDLCVICGRSAKVASQHCDHFNKHRGQLFDCGKVACVMNDTPSFYDISGVNVPADRIAFVLQKVASGETLKEASLESSLYVATRPPMLLTKAAGILAKMSRMEKQIQGIVEGDKNIDLDAFTDDEDEKNAFIIKVKNYPGDEVIDGCNRKGILLSPSMLFNIMANDCDSDVDAAVLRSCDDDCCGDLSCIMQELEEADDCNEILSDGSFDQHMPIDLNLEDILDSFLPEFGTSVPVIQSKAIRIVIKPKSNKKKQDKEASFNKYAQEALRNTYARYLLSFAAQNDDVMCKHALLKIAAYCK